MNRLSTLILSSILTAACSDFATAPDRTPSELRVRPDTLQLLTGEVARFDVELVDENGEVYERIPSWSPPLWRSDRPDRVELTDGNVKPLRGGEQLLHVELAGLEAEAVLRANPTDLWISVPMLHITQGVQRRSGGVPLIAGRDGLLRVVVNGDDENFYRPRLRATFQVGGEPIHSVTLELEAEGVPTTVTEGSLRRSYNAEIPGSVLRPGVAVVVEVDPDSVVPAATGSILRVPATGAQELQVREVPPFRLTLVPVEQRAFPQRQPRFTPSFGRQVTRLTTDVFPFGEFDLEVRDPYVTEAALNTDPGWFQLIEEIRFLRLDDGSRRYYYGGFDRPLGTGIAGLGYLGYPVAIGMDDRSDVIAHEIGHTLDLPHAPCGGAAGADPEYPYPNGRVGQFGYDRSTGTLQDPRDRFDLMSYCDPIWISDYNYQKVLEYRETSPFDLTSDARGAAASAAGEQRTLVVQGGVLDGRLQLEPALEWTSHVAMPDRGGRYTLEGLDARGTVLFSLSLEPIPLDHGGSSQFLVALPVEMAKADRLERLRLTGPEGIVERARSTRVFGAAPEVRVEPEARPRAGAQPGLGQSPSAVARWDNDDYPLAVVRDRQTGLIRAMSRTGAVAIPEGDTGRFEVLLSDGLGTREGRVVRP